MENAIANGECRKIDELTAEMNAWLTNLVLLSARAEGIKDFFDVAVIGYSTDEQSIPIVGPAMIGPLAGRDIVAIGEIANCPSRVDTVRVSIPDEETGEIRDILQHTPIWIEPLTRGWAPVCSAIVKACELLDAWIAQHPDSFPPIVINLTDGESSEGDPIPYADALKERTTSDGSVLFLNWCLSSVAADSCLFKGNDENLSEGQSRRLFAMSSVLPHNWLDGLRHSCSCDSLEPNARGFVCNKSMHMAVTNALSWFRGAGFRR